MADVSSAPAVPAEETAPAAPATTEPTESTKEITEDAPAATTTAETNGEPKLTADDVDKAGPQATTEINPPEGEGKAEADVASAATAADSTSASGKSSKRKSSAGVPEHKTKKLNKKKSMVNLNLDLEAGDMVWARLKGHPPWPAVVCDEQMLPESLLGSRPVSTKRPDGSYREDFLDGGKNAKDRTYPVMFFATNEFAWMVNTALTRLEASEIDLSSEKKMQPALKEAHKIASEGHDLDHFKSVLRQHEDEIKEYEQQEREAAERKAAEAAEKAEKKAAEKERRKSKVADDDAMDVDMEKPSKKRKKEAESEGEGPKAKKTPKVKLSTKEPKPESAKKSKAKKKADKVEEDLPEDVRLERREKAIFYLRHRLQKGFLSSDAPPKDDDMPAMADFFDQLEQHKDLEAAIIRNTKIHKVLKNILRLDTVPRDDEFNFKKRSQDMLDHWGGALSAPTDGKAEAKPATNGAAKSEEPAKAEESGAKEETKEETKDEVKEPAEAPVEATNPGNDAGDEADVSMVDSSVVEPKAEKPEEAKGGAEKTVTDGGETKTDAEVTGQPVAS
ncbi:hypothetical protein B9Z65_640 [Elsinoe australis]|uniref:PWWP domain-containing protein n=1 Tax=Elsinoe australis TaxID=40998 RepID=A0A2P8AJ43_9PEZI|nr:hypothetical protein B9Z65_640 [Elsinoe australis]